MSDLENAVSNLLLKTKMWNKLSATRIKDLSKWNISDFISKLLMDIRVAWESDFLYFTPWKVLHSIAEDYVNGIEPTIEKAMEYLDREKAEYTNIVDWDISEAFTQEDLSTVIDHILCWFDNMKWIIPKWIAEGKIETDDFVWYIDLETEDEIVDYKFVKSFNSKWQYDSVPWYIIQWALYALHKPHIKRVKFIEILKTKPLITKWYGVTKPYITEQIQLQFWVIPDPKLTIDQLLEEYKPAKPATQEIVFECTDEFIKFWQDVLDISIKVRNMILEANNNKSKAKAEWILKAIESWDEITIELIMEIEKWMEINTNELSEKIWYEVSKLKKLVDDKVNDYYLMKQDGQDILR